MAITDSETDLLTVAEVAKYLRLQPESVRRRLRDGTLPGINLGHGSGWRVRRADLAQLLDGSPAVTENPTRAIVEITCVTKVSLQNPHTGITHLGSRGRRWSKEEAIKLINDGTHTFVAVRDGLRAEIAIYDGPYAQYLRSRIDDQWDDTLLDLPACSDSQSPLESAGNPPHSARPRKASKP